VLDKITSEPLRRQARDLFAQALETIRAQEAIMSKQDQTFKATDQLIDSQRDVIRKQDQLIKKSDEIIAGLKGRIAKSEADSIDHQNRIAKCEARILGNAANLAVADRQLQLHRTAFKAVCAAAEACAGIGALAAEAQCTRGAVAVAELQRLNICSALGGDVTTEMEGTRDWSERLIGANA